MELREAFYRTFTDDPVNWIKWIAVLAILVLGYVIAILIYGKVSYRLSWERKRDIAKSRNHIIQARLIDKHSTGSPGHYSWYGTYLYTIDGVEKKYKAYFHEPSTPPRILYLYYIDNPKRLFSVDEYHYQNHKAIILFPIICLPWILGIAAIFLLRIEIPGL